MGQFFDIVEHVIAGQHIREYPGAIRTKQEDVVQLAIKQYIPHQRPDPVPDDAVTLIGTHANGFPKETYEPFTASLCEQLAERGVCVRAVWMADSSHQGASGVLNEHIQGDSPNWFDHSRDLLQMINTFRHEMPRPLIGFAHSFSCAQMVHLSVIHPRLLSALILCEPILLDKHLEGPNPGLPSSLRRDLWKSREEAETKLRKAYRAWHPEALKMYLKHGLRQLPTSIFDSKDAKAVTLTTTKHMETWTFAMMKLEPPGDTDRLFYPDQDSDLELKYISARPEASIAFRLLPQIRPNVLFVFGEKSPLSPKSENANKIRATGVGVGGSGGEKLGKVDGVVIAGAGHLLPFEHVDKYAETSAEWLKKWIDGWRADEEVIHERQSRSSDVSKQRMSEEFLAAIKMKPTTLRPLTLPTKKTENKL